MILPIARAAAGLLAAASGALVARRAGARAASGAVAASTVGTAAVAAGWNWGALRCRNDAVNLLATVAGGVVTMMLAFTG